MLHEESKIYVAGHTGMVGSALCRRLKEKNYKNILTRTRSELDLLNMTQVRDFLKDEKPNYIFLAAAKVGGIQANTLFKADFIYENLQIQNNVIWGSVQAGIKHLCFLGSSCIYPRNCEQPIKENCLLTGPLEETNSPYAVAKIAGVKLCESCNAQFDTCYISVMPSNLFGLEDNYDAITSHVLPALIRKAHHAKVNQDAELVVWGTGRPFREFLYVDDLADACVFLMEKNIEHGIYNIGVGKDISIQALAELVMNIVGYKGRIVFDTNKPDGTPRKLLDISHMHKLGWQAKTSLREGIKKTYAHYLWTMDMKR